MFEFSLEKNTTNPNFFAFLFTRSYFFPFLAVREAGDSVATARLKAKTLNLDSANVEETLQMFPQLGQYCHEILLKTGT